MAKIECGDKGLKITGGGPGGGGMDCPATVTCIHDNASGVLDSTAGNLITTGPEGKGLRLDCDALNACKPVVSIVDNNTAITNPANPWREGPAAWTDAPGWVTQWAYCVRYPNGLVFLEASWWRTGPVITLGTDGDMPDMLVATLNDPYQSDVLQINGAARTSKLLADVHLVGQPGAQSLIRLSSLTPSRINPYPRTGTGAESDNQLRFTAVYPGRGSVPVHRAYGYTGDE